MDRFDLSELQAKAILDMRLQKLTGMEIEALRKEHQETQALIESLEAILADKGKILSEIKRELLDLKDKFGDERRTQIVEGEAGIDIEDLIPKQEVVVTITKDGYIKRIPTETYHTQHRGGKGLIGIRPKEEDYVVDCFITHSHDYLMFFTNHGRVYWLKAYKIPEADRHAKGKAIINLLPRLEEGEKVETALPIHEFDDHHYLIFATKKGTIKKTELSQYSNIRINGIRAINLEDGDELINIELSDGNKTVMIATAKGQACRFSEKEIRAMGRATYGVIGIRLRDKDDSVVAMTVTDMTGSLLTITKNGFGKRSPIDEYRFTHRGSHGVRTIITNDRNGDVVFVSQVTDDNELIITTEQGMTVRIPVRDIREQGRNTQGVRIMRLNDGDKVVSVTKTVPVSENGTPCLTPTDGSGMPPAPPAPPVALPEIHPVDVPQPEDEVEVPEKEEPDAPQETPEEPVETPEPAVPKKTRAKKTEKAAKPKTKPKTHAAAKKPSHAKVMTKRVAAAKRKPKTVKRVSAVARKPKKKVVVKKTKARPEKKVKKKAATKKRR